jgi:iron(III) transport system ATP-binding protein
VVLNGDSTALTARAVGITYHGHDATVRLVVASGSELLARVPGHALPSIGETLTVAVRGDVVAFPGIRDGHDLS